jgi:glutamine amidotransferase
MVSIVDYGTGNLRSVQNMLRSIGVDSTIAKTPKEVAAATKLVLPGVGHFGFGMKSLIERDLVSALNQKVLEQKTPVLGICLGAQLLTRGSEEGGVAGLGWIEADTKGFDTSRIGDSLRVPHMGWADTEYSASSRLFADTEADPRFYYVHSYHMVCDKPSDELCHATHGYRFVAGVERQNIFGVQFHPEKSHRFGKHILSCFTKPE